MAKPSQIKKVVRPDRDQLTINMTIYGEPGIGKTRLIGEGSGKTLILRPPTDHTTSVTKGRAEEWVVRDWSEMDEAYEYVRHDGEQYDWVWLDSISLWQDIGLDDIWAKVIQKNPHRKEYGLDKGEYGVNMFRLGQWLRNMATLGSCNFGVTAHPREMAIAEIEDSDEKMMPFVQGKNMATKLCGYMHVVGFYDMTDKGKRILRLNASDEYYAKDQLDAFEGGKMLDPSMDKINQKIQAALKGRAEVTKTKKTNKGK